MHRKPFFASRALQAFKAAGLPPGLHFTAAKADAPAEILIYAGIGLDPWTGEGVAAVDIVRALASAGGGPVSVRINSPGGDVFEGVAIYNAMRNYSGEITTYVDGIAASAASYIATAGARTVMSGPSAMMMIHNASTFAWGNRHTLAETLAALEKIDGEIVGMYAAKAGDKAGDFAALMDAESYLTAAECIDLGIADAITEPPKRTPAAVAPPGPTAEVLARRARAAALA